MPQSFSRKTYQEFFVELNALRVREAHISHSLQNDKLAPSSILAKEERLREIRERIEQLEVVVGEMPVEDRVIAEATQRASAGPERGRWSHREQD